MLTLSILEEKSVVITHSAAIAEALRLMSFIILYLTNIFKP